MDGVAPPFDQLKETAPLAVKVAGNPEQTVSLLTVTIGKAFTVTLPTAEDEHPPGFPVTVYDAAIAGVMVMLFVAEPFDH